MSASRYGFLLDENAQGLAELFPRGRALTVANLGLVGASDDRVLDEASQTDRILVTVNRDDFVKRYEKRALALPRATHAPDILSGLIVLSDDVAKRWRRGTLRDTERRLRLLGQSLAWHDVYVENLFVRVRIDVVDVRFLPCRHCSGTEDGYTDKTRP
jgi:Domain of unknown function (DUF5615)